MLLAQSFPYQNSLVLWSECDKYSLYLSQGTDWITIFSFWRWHCRHFEDAQLLYAQRLSLNQRMFWNVHVHDNTSIRLHYDDVIMTMLASQITSLPVVCSIVYSDVNQRKHQSSASLAFVREIHRGPVNFPHKWPVTRKMFPFDDVIML